MWQLDFIVRGSIAILLVSLICGGVGSLVVSNRMSFFSDALAHCAFAGVAFGLLIALVSGVEDKDFRHWITAIRVGFGILVGLLIAYVHDFTPPRSLMVFAGTILTGVRSFSPAMRLPASSATERSFGRPNLSHMGKLKRQIPTGLDVTASGIPYWSNDTGGWQYLPAVHHPAHKPLLDPSDARATVGGYDDYPELYTRWFQYARSCPSSAPMAAGRQTESGPTEQAEPILENYLRLRYELCLYLLACLPHVANRSPHHARAAAGFSRRPQSGGYCG